MKHEKGFTLVELMCSLFVLSLTLLLFGGLAQTISQVERRSALHLAISRDAVTLMENFRSRTTPVPGTSSRILLLQNVAITETQVIAPNTGLTEITITYSWQQGGHPYVQTWATLHS